MGVYSQRMRQNVKQPVTPMSSRHKCSLNEAFTEPYISYKAADMSGTLVDTEVNRGERKASDKQRKNKWGKHQKERGSRRQRNGANRTTRSKKDTEEQDRKRYRRHERRKHREHGRKALWRWSSGSENVSLPTAQCSLALVQFQWFLLLAMLYLYH